MSRWRSSWATRSWSAQWARRKRAGLTLDDLGSRVGKPAPYLSLLENGKKEPKLGLINDLSRALGVEVADLLAQEAPSRRAALEVA
ncbi:MAG: helix-turn-helix transcriptional regulator, partial [Caldilinea sp.]